MEDKNILYQTHIIIIWYYISWKNVSKSLSAIPVCENKSHEIIKKNKF